MTRRQRVIAGISIAFVSISVLQAQRRGTLQVSGYSGDAPVVYVEGRAFVDVEALARITEGSVSRQGDRIVLTLTSTASMGEESASPGGFSRPFASAAIEAIAAMREWASTLTLAIEHGYPVGSGIAAYRARALDQMRLAGTEATTEADRSALQLLTNEFNNVDLWSNRLVTARNSMSAGNLAMSENALRSDPLFQSILRCGQFLGSMLASGNFQDEGACR